MGFQSTINQAIGTMGALAGVKKVVEGQQAQEAATKKQTESIEKQTEAINAQTDKVAEQYNRIPEAGEQLIAAQASRKALQSLMNAQYPYRNLKNWSPEKQLNQARLDEYRQLESALNTAKQYELDKGKEMPQLSKNLTEEEGGNE